MEKSINIQLNNADSISHDIADLLCWWEGFKMGLKLSDNDHFIVAENGIERIKTINIKIKEQLNTKYDITNSKN